MDYSGYLASGLNTLGLTWSTEQLEQLNAYCREIDLWNPRYNLVRAAGEEFVVRHIMDALAAVPVLQRLLPRGSSMADAGSGNGVPGIPLAVMLPGIRMVLIERSGKRSGFLRNAAAAAGLHPRVSVFEGDLRQAGFTCDAVTFRAVARLREIYPMLAPLLKKHGVIAAYKGTDRRVAEEITELTAERPELTVRTADITNPLMDGYRRQLVLISG